MLIMHWCSDFPCDSVSARNDNCKHDSKDYAVELLSRIADCFYVLRSCAVPYEIGERLPISGKLSTELYLRAKHIAISQVQEAGGCPRE